MSVKYGRFFVSKKESNCFEILEKEKAPHMLLEESWGGSGDRGDLAEDEDMLYYRRATSNGGGTGYTYAIFPKGWQKNTVLRIICKSHLKRCLTRFFFPL